MRWLHSILTFSVSGKTRAAIPPFSPETADGNTQARRRRVGGMPFAATAGAVAALVTLGFSVIPSAPLGYSTARAAEMDKTAASPDHDDYAISAERLAEKLKDNPNDADGWLLYARTVSNTKQWDKAIDGYRKAIALGKTDADVQSALGEMLVMQADGIVTPPAHDALIAALKANPKDDVALYYMAIAAGQAGQPQMAIDRFQSLLAAIPEDSPMRDEIAKRIGEAAKAAGLPMPELAKGQPAEPVDPDDAALASLSGKPEAEQKAVAALIVSKLTNHLATEPKDIEGWQRLGRAYLAAADRDKAGDAFQHAAALKPGDIAIRLTAVASLLEGLQPNDPLPPTSLALLREVEAVAPNEPEVLWYLGIAAARDGRHDDALAYWNRLLTQLPVDGEDAKMVRKTMDSLKGG